MLFPINSSQHSNKTNIYIVLFMFVITSINPLSKQFTTKLYHKAAFIAIDKHYFIKLIVFLPIIPLILNIFPNIHIIQPFIPVFNSTTLESNSIFVRISYNN